MINCAIVPENIDSLPKMVSELESTGADSIRLDHVSFLTEEDYEKQMKVPKDILDAEIHQHEEQHSEAPAPAPGG